MPGAIQGANGFYGSLVGSSMESSMSSTFKLSDVKLKRKDAILCLV